MFSIGHWKLEGHVPVPCTFEEWLAWMQTETWENGLRRVAETTVSPEPNRVWVSTVFLGLDHAFGRQGPPILFETMIFGGEHDQYQTRCATWDEAEAMHEVAVAIATAANVKSFENQKEKAYEEGKGQRVPSVRRRRPKRRPEG